jgi:HSP90 family molecular chaperone
VTLLAGYTTLQVSRLLDLIVHSLYSHKEVFLRELVSNASDALDKVRFLSDMDPSQVEPDINLEIRIKPDLESGTITISYASSILNTPFVVT